MATLFSIPVNLFLFCYIHLFHFLDSTCNWLYPVFIFLCLTIHWAKYPPSPCTLLQMAEIHSFLWLRNIPLHMYMCVCVCVGGNRVKEPACQCRRCKKCRGLIPGWGRSPRGGHSNPLQYSYLENPKDRGVWGVIVCRVTKNRTWLKWLSTRSWTLEHVCLFELVLLFSLDIYPAVELLGHVVVWFSFFEKPLYYFS